jgi:hypothetical protein
VYRINFEIKLESPLVVGRGLEGYVVRSREFIPGSVLRGALGAVMATEECMYPQVPDEHEQCGSNSECLYYRVFGPERCPALVQFHNAYKLCEKDRRSLPAPLYWKVCKRCGTPRNFIEDFAERGFVFRPYQCDGEEEVYEDPKGFWCFCEDPPRPVRVDFCRITRTSIDPSTLTAKEGTLHSFDALREGQTFGTHITAFHKVGDRELTVEDAERLIGYVKELEREGIGKGKSRGLGEISIRNISLEEISKEKVREEAEEILKDLEASKEKWGGRAMFVLNTLSPLILEDGSRKIEPRIIAGYMRRAHQLVFRSPESRTPEIEVRLVQASTAIHGGWSLKERRRKPIVSGLDSGSSIFIEGEPSEYLAECLAALKFYNFGKYKCYGNGEMGGEVIG